jgi:hypothetical protein
MGLFSGLKKAFGKEEAPKQDNWEKSTYPSERKAPVGVRTEATQNSEHRKNIEDSLVQMHRDYLSRRVSFDTMMDTLDDLRDKMANDDALARSKRLPSTLYGIFTATKDLKVQRGIAEIIHAQAIKGNPDAVRIAKMLHQLAGDPVTKDLTSRASKMLG